jgi:hypothetical protein
MHLFIPLWVFWAVAVGYIVVGMFFVFAGYVSSPTRSGVLHDWIIPLFLWPLFFIGR